jgi:adiponectin receptor
MYGVLGLSIFIPAIHGVILHGWALQNERMSLTYFMGLGILNGTGTAIYTARIPERWYPRRFDIYGSSHQIMHVLVVCGALSHTVGLV